MRMHETRDLTIIGGGPTGLFAMFYAGMRGASSQIVDALPEVGGQLAALYPEKFIFDVGGFRQILARDLVRNLQDQAAQFGQPVHLGQRVVSLADADGLLVLETETDRFPSRGVIIAAGVGAFSPRRLPQACAEPWYGRGIYDRVLDPESFRGKRVVVIGGGDTAFDWTAQLLDRASALTLVHRSDRYRAHAATVAQVQAAAAVGRVTMLPFHELHDVFAEDGHIASLELRNLKTKDTHRVVADVVLPMLGFVSELGPIASWGLTLDKHDIVVNSLMETGRPGVYAAGDIAVYPGKLKLIANGFGEAAIAVNQAVHRIYPEKKVNPGHSSNMAIFGQTE
jgi:thioredoxin reductase (NADPH)